MLNVSAESMSALAEDPLHFLRWVQHHIGGHVKPSDFLPRHVYWEYVESVLQEEVRLRPRQFEWRHDEASFITRSGNILEIRLRNGEVIDADKVVLALGNFPASDPRLPGESDSSPRYISDVSSQGLRPAKSHVLCEGAEGVNRHIRPYWEVHRHRLAPEIDAHVASLLRSGQMQIHAGRITIMTRVKTVSR
jgi:uncharacterized NAD(P)/FAD-binding protein YdhS